MDSLAEGKLTGKEDAERPLGRLRPFAEDLGVRAVGDDKDLFRRNSFGHELVPQALGGAQERGRRAGTHAVAAIVGFGAAAAEVAGDGVARATATARLRDRLETRVLALPGVHRNGIGARGPKHLNVRVDGVDGEELLIALDVAGVEVSAGSACSAGSLEPSHVLLAMGLGRDAARASVRFSLSPRLTEAEVDAAAERFAETVQRLRSV